MCFKNNHNLINRKGTLSHFWGAVALLPFTFYAHSAPELNSINNQQIINQQERQKALEEQLAPEQPDVRLELPAGSSAIAQFPSESNCITINQVTLSGSEHLTNWLMLQRVANQAKGHCIGGKGINLLMSAIQNRLVDRGYITSRVLAPPQDVNSGELKLQIMEGKVSHILFASESDSYIQMFNTLPVSEGDLLNLRDIEQGVENLRRVPTAQADVNMLPGAEPGETDLAISWKQSRHWRLGASLDDSGTTSTGRYQGGLTLYVDNPLSLSDTFYISGGHDLQWKNDRGSHNYTAHYSVPYGYWGFNVTTSAYSYNQKVAGLIEDYDYSGDSNNLTFGLSRLLHRNASQKTTLTYDVLLKSTRNYINDTEVEVQRRNTSAWRLGLQHRHYIYAATLDAGVSYQQGTRWFGAQPAPEEYTGLATALSKIAQISANLDVPFSLFEQKFSFRSQYQRQLPSSTSLTSQDRFSIGGRYTVRGYDGELSLSADRGWFTRNELAWQTPLPSQELYAGLDYGEVGGRGSEYLLGKHLAGAVLGLRGNAFNTSYDLFAGIPTSKPDGFKTDPVTLGFNLNWQY
ncbi:ShlB/FhaC/HecB family hemolysin secretion/activation protein [Budviciaceae bacterium BWR-B9]|uniref:ShlB/FhaC/HecB family hemolysin secretion/activation protein n=1 Tax=Limnobaculum allomyrinae TaxID=2791986 RepID=A0ABS1ISE4_9GAMM|nr:MULTISPECIES: ShlB/FhaC/HecB family hemolysin secretion/activation protein [Limnobaculum]MBK5144462.1 ShlB/FhaC/HecB family hemolysin secretion/activation protein [Limnobaculum allomyrinae]MBV7692311.1 ShlB/FhaC/HecB family hemolysin secretion/activation protein [Limnobaculum sp. M2-1]